MADDRKASATTLLFAATLFASATLLFWVQPMIGKMLLPAFGGAPAVWNGCMVFFQICLLAGYLIAHWSSTRLSPSAQFYFHICLLFAGALFLPISYRAADIQAQAAGRDPLWLLLARLAGGAAIPFIVLATTAPLLQRWYSQFPASMGAAQGPQERQPHAEERRRGEGGGIDVEREGKEAGGERARVESGVRPAGEGGGFTPRLGRDPYFLYAASNAGSFAALLAFPFLFEPLLKLREQSFAWMGGYFCFAGLLIWCGFLFRKNAALARFSFPLPLGEGQGEGGSEKPLGLRKSISLPSSSVAATPFKWKWLWFAMIPSSLMLGATEHITTDIASAPLLWIIPLALYLLSFVIVFARGGAAILEPAKRALPFAAVLLVYLMVSQVIRPGWFIALAHLVFFFLVALYFHGQLVLSRPPGEQSTKFYLGLSAGGALGGILNTLLAPALFDTIVEYPLMIVLGLVVMDRIEQAVSPELKGEVLTESETRSQSKRGLSKTVRLWRDALNAIALAILFATVVFAGLMLIQINSLWEKPLLQILILGSPLLASLFLRKRRFAFVFCLAAALLAGRFAMTVSSPALRVERNFFGVLKVSEDPRGPYRRFYHGTTLHGLQFGDAENQCLPIAYYHPYGPLGDAFKHIEASSAPINIAVTGLGAGGLAAYARPRQNWTFYEINPAVVEIARNTNYFTFLSDCAPPGTQIVLGDARLQMQKTETLYDVIVLDAFSSDAIPIHLITQEALQVYLGRLAPRGFLLLHITNRHLDLKPHLRATAHQAGLAALVSNTARFDHKQFPHMYFSEWVILARDPALLEDLSREEKWLPLKPGPGDTAWTDDFSNIVSALKWLPD